MSSRVSLSGLDSAFLSLETPSAPMNVVGTLVLDASSPSGACSYERVQQHSRLGVGALGEWTEFTPTRLLAMAARFYSDQKLANRHRPLHNLVISNVRGPGSRLHVAGAPLCAAYPLGPLMDGVGLNLTVSSYAESVDFGVVACERSVPHAGDIALGFGAAVGQLRKLALERPSESLRLGCEAAKADPFRVAAAKES